MREIKLGLIGAGWMGCFHMVGFTNVRRAYGDAVLPVFDTVCDIDRHVAASAAEKFGFQRITADWHDVIANPDIEMIIVATPNHLHAEIVIEAAAAGKHILCEKPMGMDAAQSRAMAEAVTRAGVRSLVDFIYRKMPANVYAKDLLQAGRLGEVLTFRGAFDCDYCVDPSVPSKWRQYASLAGTGALGDLTAHLISLSDMLVGSEIVEVFARWETVYPTRRKAADTTEQVAVDTDDQVYAIVKYASGHIGQMSSSRIAAGKPCAMGYEIQGTQGTLKYDLTRLNELQYFDNRAADRGFQVLKGSTAHGDYKAFCAIDEIGVSYADVMGIQAHDMLEAIAYGKPIDIDIPYGYYVDRVMAAMAESARTGRMIRVAQA